MSDNGTTKAPEGRERRQYDRHSEPPLTLRIEGQRYRTHDWSLGGFRIGAFHRELKPGETLTGDISKFAGLVRDPFEADVVRLTSEGEVCCRFLVMPNL